ncbi:MAG: hypothetical protein V7638_3891 [Acidobacteriota bacterium]|jgi:hypothetical protein
MLRSEWDDKYFPDEDGRITLESEWYGQSIYIPYLWQQAVQDNIVPDEGDHGLHLLITPADRHLFPELGNRRFVQIKVRAGQFVKEEKEIPF